MANSLVLDWLYENELRAYPLKETITRSFSALTITDNMILDAQLAYDADPGNPGITNVLVSGNNVTFTVTGGQTFLFSKVVAFPQSKRSTNNQLLVAGSGIVDIPDGNYATSNVLFEPSVVHEFYGAWLGVQSLTFDGSAALTGAIDLHEGFQFDVDIDTQDLRLGANSLYGIPAACEHFGPKPNNCSDIISFINGVQPDGNNEIQLLAGNGINVWDDPENHRIYVGFNFTSINDICKDIPPSPLG